MVASSAKDQNDEALTLNAELAKRVREEAERRGVEAQVLVNELLATQLDEDERFRAAVEVGLEQARAGDLVPMEDVDAQIDELMARTEAERAG